MARSLLVINAGSSSIKFAVFTVDDVDVPGAPANARPRGGPTAPLRLVPGPAGQVEAIGVRPHLEIEEGGRRLADRALDGERVPDHRAALAEILGWLTAHTAGRPPLAAGHRVVHGGMRHSAPLVIDDRVLAALEELVPLAPLHQPHNLAAIRAVAEMLPGVPQVACFDTAFHRTQPEVAQAFALPRRLYDEGVRRYGFHGLSYEYVAGALPALAGEAANGRVVVAHLGAGASMCAIRGGQSVASTMGFTALDGLPMGTRTGDLDPGVLLYLMDRHGLDARALERLLYHESGLLGVSGVSSDMRMLLASDDPRAREAVDLFVYRVGRELGSLAAALGGLDALVFTAGIGERSPEIRARVCRDAAWLGVVLDEDANRAGGPCISAAGAPASAWVVKTDENIVIARHTLAALGLESSGRPRAS